MLPSGRSGAVLGAGALLALTVLAAAHGIRGDDVLTGGVIAGFWIAGIVARWAKPASDAAGWLLVAGVVGEWFIVVNVVAGIYPAPEWALVARVLQCLTFAAWLTMMAVYPDDRPDQVARVVVGSVAVLSVLLPLWAYLAERGPDIPLAGAYQVLFAVPVLGLLLLVRTYRRRGPGERRQLRWVLLGMALAASFYAFSATPLNTLIPPVLDAVLFAAVTLFVAVSAAIGLVRPQVVDVDLVLRRFPVFAVLWLLITGIYAAATASLSVGAGQHLPVQWAVVLTVACALLFQPVRRRLERLADRAVFGRRLDGYDVLHDLSASLGATTHLDEVGQVITTAIRAGVDASWVRLLSAGGLAVYGQAGEPAGPAVLSIPVVHAGTEVGVLECGRRRSGGYTDADRDVVATVARQAALAVLNVQRAAAVAASRRRLVDAADAERSRIERDLHDGVQQHLVALMAAIETARRAEDPAISESALATARDIGQGAMVELRAVIGGILPPVLADGGLVAAVQARAGQLPVPVRVEVLGSAGGRFSRETEVAAYFFVSETLVNVVRHACASSAQVRLCADAERLRVSVSDDGTGIAAGTPLRGLQGLQDRFAALAGSVRVEPGPDGGTVVAGELPL